MKHIKKACLGKSRRSNPFSLLELLIVIALLGLITGLIGINVRKAVQEESFRAETKAVLHTLRLAQNLMLLLKQDVHVIFTSQGKKGIKYKMTFDFPLPKGWEKELTRSRATLKSIHRVEMEDLKQTNQTTNGELDIRFLSNGAVMSQGILHLSSQSADGLSSSKLDRYICLPGYPAPLSIQVNAPACPPKEDQALDAQLTSFTMQEIHALQEKT